MCETSNTNQKHLRAEFHQKCSYSTSKKQKPGGKSKPKHKHTQSKYHKKSQNNPGSSFPTIIRQAEAEAQAATQQQAVLA